MREKIIIEFKRKLHKNTAKRISMSLLLKEGRDHSRKSSPIMKN